jgi:hypothetical protein
MTVLNGHTYPAMGGVGGPRGQANGAPQPVADFGSGSLSAGGNLVIDGTPLRVVVLAFAAAAGLVALRFGGFRFNVGVSS